MCVCVLAVETHINFANWCSIDLLHQGYLGTGVPGKLEMVEMEVKSEVKMEVEMDAPILPSSYTGALAPPYK